MKRDNDINYNDDLDPRENISSINAQQTVRDNTINKVIVQKLFTVSSACPLLYDDENPLVKLHLSKFLCLTLNPHLINHDESFYNNLPWNTWTINPQLKNRRSTKKDNYQGVLSRKEGRVQ